MIQEATPQIDVNVELFQWIFVFLFQIVVAIVTWIFVKRHFQKRELALKDQIIISQVVDNESVAVDILSKKLAFYNKMQDDIEARCVKHAEDLSKEIDKLKITITKIREYNELLENRCKEYEKNI